MQAAVDAVLATKLRDRARGALEALGLRLSAEVQQAVLHYVLTALRDGAGVDDAVQRARDRHAEVMAMPSLASVRMCVLVPVPVPTLAPTPAPIPALMPTHMSTPMTMTMLSLL